MTKPRPIRVLPVVKRILGEHLISAAPLAEDAEHNTDLIVLRLEAVRIGVRIRSANYWTKPDYRGDFTIRAGRPNGHKTELTKIVEGWGDYFFYGFATPDYNDLIAYVLGDLRVFRLWFNQRLAQLPRGQYPGQRLENGDGSSFFYAYKITDLPAAFVVARAMPVCTTPPSAW